MSTLNRMKRFKINGDSNTHTYNILGKNPMNYIIYLNFVSVFCFAKIINYNGNVEFMIKNCKADGLGDFYRYSRRAIARHPRRGDLRFLVPGPTH